MTAMRRLQDIAVSTAPAGHAPHLPGLGHPLAPPWTLNDYGPGMIVSAADRPISRTAYLHVDYLKVTPIDEPLFSRGQIDRIDGRKAFPTATMTDSDGAVLSEATA